VNFIPKFTPATPTPKAAIHPSLGKGNGGGVGKNGGGDGNSLIMNSSNSTKVTTYSQQSYSLLV